MAVFKCKMCGGQLDIQEDQTVIECEYCGSKQTIPVLDDEKKISLFSRANKLRMACDFDKAFSVYESIVAEYENEAEGYWGLILCKYGIEYVDDPVTGKKVPTCHRTSFDSVMDDPNFDLVMENADGVARKVYRDEAKQIESLRTKIIEISSNEDPYDIFICYKETAEDGNRTIDSVIAQDIYTELTNKGYKVFFSRITLEDKLGQEYEPYIFSALNSAKVMLVFGTDYEYFNAVWVKNEWSRYLKLMSSGQKKTLIPCYKDIDAYDMPKEFKHLQAQDMGKVGATQDLLRGIEKIIPLKKEEKVIQQTVVMQSAEEPLLKRVFMFLEDKQWKEADTYCEKVLDINPECAKAYLGKFMSKYNVSTIQSLNTCNENQFADNLYKKAVLFANNAFRKQLNDFVDSAKERAILMHNKQKQLEEQQLKEMQQWDTDNEAFKDKLIEKRNYLSAIKDVIFLPEGINGTIAIKEDGSIIGVGTYFNKEITQWKDVYTLVNGRYTTVGIRNDGTVIAVGENRHGECNVNDWTDIVAVCVDSFSTIGLKVDGTLVAIGSNNHGQCNVERFKDIVQVLSMFNTTFVLKANGEVTEVGRNYKFYFRPHNWTNIKRIYINHSHLLVGIKEDGTIKVTGDQFDNNKWNNNWSDIIDVVTTNHFMVGLKSNGTVECISNTIEKNHIKEVSKWNRILSISGGSKHVVGLKYDGTVVAIGDNTYGQCNINDWTDIVAVYAAGDITIGLKSDGTVVAIGDNTYGQCNVQDWKLFDSVDSLIISRKSADSERKRIIKEKAEYKVKQSEWRKQEKCQYCGGELKGLFGKKCVSCGKPKDY